MIVSRTQYTLRWVINSIKNPKYAALTGYFSGDIRFNNTLLFSAFAPSNYQGITFTPGKLSKCIVIEMLSYRFGQLILTRSRI